MIENIDPIQKCSSLHTSRQESAERLLEEMVNINSPTTDPFGVNHVQQILARELAQMGFDVGFLPNPMHDVHSGDLLTATFKGERSAFITFVSHADTVLDIHSAGRFERLSDGKTARGSGVIDNKGGLVVALQGLRLYLEGLKARDERPKLSLRFVSSPNEEAGSLGFHEAFRSYAEDSVIVLGFEPALDNGSIVGSRRGNRWYQIQVKGQEAHAGRCKGEEINAAHDLAMKIMRIHKLNNPKEGVSVNVAQLEGGRDRFNVVCGEMNAKLDARFASFASRDELHRNIERILLTPAITSSVTGQSSQTTYSILDDCPPFSSTSESRKLLAYYLQKIKEVEGRAVKAERAGGAGDVNYMSRRGVAVFDGLGPVGGKMHTTEEFVHLPSLVSRSLVLAAFLEEAEPKLRQGMRRFGFLRGRA